jgi:hypothetical protein
MVISWLFDVIVHVAYAQGGTKEVVICYVRRDGLPQQSKEIYTIQKSKIKKIVIDFQQLFQ